MFRPDPARKLSADLCDIYNCCVYSAGFLSSSVYKAVHCPKHVEF